jgi:hypothetical protein
MYILMTARLILSSVLENSIPSIRPLSFREQRVRQRDKS